jgi:hypothetical protein
MKKQAVALTLLKSYGVQQSNKVPLQTNKFVPVFK